MKIKNIIVLMSTLLVGITACEKGYDTADLSDITYYPEFTLQGSNKVFSVIGQAYQEPGVVATEEGTEIPITTSVIGAYFGYKGTTVNTTVGDKYEVTYSATNSDGFAGNASRIVYVFKNGDLISNISGLYKSTVVRNGASGAAYTNMEYVIINKTADNQYALSDGIGGYYDFGRGYGPAYAAQGVVITAVNIPANNFTFNNPFEVGAFGGSAEITSMTVNSAAKTITYTTVWDAGYTFVTTLKQVEF